MFRVHAPIIRSIRCWVAAYGFLHRVFGWLVILRAAVYGADVAMHGTIRTVHSGSPKTRCRKPYAATQHLMLLMMGVCTRNMGAKNTSIKLPCCIKLAFHFISWGRCTVKQPSSTQKTLCDRLLSGYLFRPPKCRSSSGQVYKNMYVNRH